MGYRGGAGSRQGGRHCPACLKQGPTSSSTHLIPTWLCPSPPSTAASASPPLERTVCFSFEVCVIGHDSGSQAGDEEGSAWGEKKELGPVFWTVPLGCNFTCLYYFSRN